MQKYKRIPRVTRGSFRIMLEPEGRRDIKKYYTISGGRIYWTAFRELAKDFDIEETAVSTAARIIANNARLRDRVIVRPA